MVISAAKASSSEADIFFDLAPTRPVCVIRKYCHIVPSVLRPVVVPRYNPLPVFIKNVLRTSRISRERYLELLQQI